MNSLFILHTQYHLILALAIIEKQHYGDENDLILFQDFNLKYEMQESICSNFNNVTIYTGSYNKVNQKWRKKIQRYPKIKAELKRSVGYYDNLYYVEDSVIPEMYALKYIKQKNPNAKVSYIGDGGDAYFVNAVRATGLAKYEWSKMFRNLVFKYIFGLGKYYSNGCFGSNQNTEYAYEMYPEYLRSELQQKTKYEVEDLHIQSAVIKLYSYLDKIEFSNKVLIIMLDKLEVYGDGEKFGQIVDMLLDKAKTERRQVYYKCHPAEKRIYNKLSNAIELDRNVPAEYVFACAANCDCEVVGVLTTALQTAKKMGLNVVSYMKSFNPARTDVIEFYEKIGIDVK